MTEANSIETRPPRKVRKRKPKKPGKPYPEFPLFPHATRRWCKKIRGAFVYFGPWADPDAALQKYLDQKDALHAGLVPRPAQPDGLAIKDLCNKFLTAKRHDLDIGEISPRTFAENYEVCERIIKTFGRERIVEDLRPEDFEYLKVQMPKTWGPHSRGKMIQKTRGVFRYAMTEGLVEKVIQFGGRFKPPSKAVMRLHREKNREENGDRMFSPAEIKAMLNAAGPQLKCMILLGANCGYGNNDVGRLPIKALDLENGWANFARPKTGIRRRAKLWPQTIAALREVLANRPKPKDEADAGRVFLTKYGKPWVKIVSTPQADGTLKVSCDDSVSKESRKLLNKLDINGGRNFYCLRHGFETVAGKSKDQVAVDHVMGHVDPGMGGVYREDIGDDRLKAVSEFVRIWLFGSLGGDR